MIRIDLYVKVVLTTIALLLGAIAFAPMIRPSPVQAQMETPSLFIEPGLTRFANPYGLGETTGKMVIDLKTGESWGFPATIGTNREAPVSKAVYLGRYDFTSMKHGR